MPFIPHDSHDLKIYHLTLSPIFRLLNFHRLFTNVALNTLPNFLHLWSFIGAVTPFMPTNVVHNTSGLVCCLTFIWCAFDMQKQIFEFRCVLHHVHVHFTGFYFILFFISLQASISFSFSLASLRCITYRSWRIFLYALTDFSFSWLLPFFLRCTSPTGLGVPFSAPSLIFLLRDYYHFFLTIT